MRGPATCEHCTKTGERPNDLITPPGWFVMFAKFDPDDKTKTFDDRLMIHACSEWCRDQLWTSKPLKFSKVTFDPKEQPALYPCGCSKHKINHGLCDSYSPHELP